jgi:hypothetical protein
LAAGRVINRRKVAKHFRLSITDTSFSYQRRDDRIQKEAALDGVYVIRTPVPKAEITTSEAVRAYKSLATVERAFRSLKTVDLKIRPIHHRREDRVRAHVFLCMLAYYVEWHMREALAPILFDEDDLEAAQAQRRSVVAPAHRSPSAEEKASAKRTPENLPVHSFQTLLKDLATIAKNKVRPKHDTPARPVRSIFEMVTVPTPVQRRILELLGVSLAT